jgi:hypothetical protein
MTTSNGEAPNGTAKKRKPAVKKVKAVAAPATTPTPTHEQIAALAEKYWAERGWPQGSPEQDWLRAEQELRTA